MRHPRAMLLISIGSPSFKELEYLQLGSRNSSRNNWNWVQLVKEWGLVNVFGNVRLVVHAAINNWNDYVQFGEKLGSFGSLNIFPTHSEAEILGVLFPWEERR